MICDNCKKQINDEAKFCNYCGRQTMVPASSNKRLLNYILDWIMAVIFAIIIMIILGYLGIFNSSYDNESAEQVFYYLFIFLYFFIFELLFKKTVAKFLTKTKVVMEDGSNPDWSHILIRSIVRFIPFDAFSFSGKNPVGWHDRWAKTRVVDDKNNIN